METYDGLDCRGEIKIQRALMYSNKTWTFQTLWDTNYRTLNCNYKEDESLIRNSATCSWSDCLCNTDDCKQFFKVGQCIKDAEGKVSNRLVYKKVDYNEQKYCSFSEDFQLNSNFVPLGLTIYRKNYCYLDQAYIDCNLYDFSIYHCANNSLIASFPDGTITEHYEQCGYSQVMFGSTNWWDADLKSFNQSNSISKYNNIPYIIIQLLITIITIIVII